MIKLHQLGNQLSFPAIKYALKEPNGLLAFGGDLSTERLVAAYNQGIFPWFSEGEPILWWSPDPRGILSLDEFHCSRSLSKFIRLSHFNVSLNTDFDQVIDACSRIPRTDNGTWITTAMTDAYKMLHKGGHAHSVEVWDEHRNLVGGLYGIAVGGVFCGESMFSRVTNSSKMAFYYLIQHMRDINADFIDCQMQNPHLKTLGCKEVSRSTFMSMLANSRKKPINKACWQKQWLRNNQ